jgi:hypothetical protein
MVNVGALEDTFPLKIPHENAKSNGWIRRLEALEKRRSSWTPRIVLTDFSAK